MSDIFSYLFSVIAIITGKKNLEGSNISTFSPTKQNEKTLYVCHNTDEIDQINTNVAPDKVIIGTDNIKIHKLFQTTDITTTFLQQPTSYYEVADQATEIANEVDNWLSELGDATGIPPESVFVERSNEGGEMERIQETLLYVKCYQKIIEDHSIDSICILRDWKTNWQDDILVSVAESQDINVVEKKSIVYWIKSLLNIRNGSVCLVGCNLQFYFPGRIFRFARLMYTFFGLVYQKSIFTLKNSVLKNLRTQTNQGDEPQVVFQLSSSAQKHVENISGVMKVLRDRKKVNPVALCWNARGGSKKLKHADLNSFNLRSAFPFRRFGNLIMNSILLIFNSSKYKNELINNRKIEYNGVKLGSHLWPEIHTLVTWKLPRRLIMQWAVTNYLSLRQPVAIKLWGAGISEYGAVTCDVAEKICEPVTFHYNVGIINYDPYFQNKAQVYLAKGDREKSQYVLNGVDANNIVISGHSRYHDIKKFKKQYSRTESQRHLDIDSENKLCIFFASQGDTFGLCPVSEKIQIVSTLISIADNFPSCAIIVKPHPSGDPEPIRAALTDENIENIHFIKDSSPYHCINAADIVVTKYSTVGIEAMLFDRPVASVALDGETNFQNVYGDVAERFNSTTQLHAFFEEILSGKEQLPDQLEARDSYLDTIFSHTNVDDETKVAEIVEYISICGSTDLNTAMSS